MATMPMVPQQGTPMMNPTGANGMGGTTQPWTMPTPTGGPGNYGYGASANPNPSASANPYAPGSPNNPTAPGMNAGGASPLPGAPTVGYDPSGAGSPTGGYTPDLNGPFGGVGGLAEQFLNSSGGYNSGLTQQAVAAQTAEMQLQANQNYGNLQSGFGAAGINPNSSAAALGSSNFWSQTATAENAMTAQEYMSMWQSSMANETSILGGMLGPAESYQQHEATSPFDWLSMGLQTAESGAFLGLAASGAF